MHYSYAMTASRVTPPADEKSADMEGVEEAGGAAVSVRGRFGQSWVSLCLTVALSMVPMTEKGVDTAKETEIGRAHV